MLCYLVKIASIAKHFTSSSYCIYIIQIDGESKLLSGYFAHFRPYLLLQDQTLRGRWILSQNPTLRGMWVLVLQFGHKQRLAALLEIFNISRRRLYLQQSYITVIQLYCINCDFSKEFANSASRLKKAKWLTCLALLWCLNWTIIYQ